MKEKPTWPLWPASASPTLLIAALWLVLCLLVAADSRTDQGSADVTKGSVCFKMLPISEVPGDVTNRQCQDHEPLEKKFRNKAVHFAGLMMQIHRAVSIRQLKMPSFTGARVKWARFEKLQENKKGLVHILTALFRAKLGSWRH